MSARRWVAAVAAGALVALAAAPSHAQGAPEYGPAAGKLVIVGGGNLTGSGVIERFIALAGGKD
ncbi:MAG: chitin-binding protein, partial [Gemmatimonadota bacterium]|nr:chitin-binding protein [Gemmatimonadota bacterium]